jgi:hypothetical protein
MRTNKRGDKMTKIILYLREDEVARLREAAIRDYRDLANQARFILRECLAKERATEVKQHETRTA